METNYSPIEFSTDAKTFVVMNDGTAPAPAKVVIIPKVDFLNLVIEGLSSEPLTFTGLKANETLEIDGENRDVSVNGEPAFSRYGGWEFPKLEPGANQITIEGGAQLNIQIEFNARYI